MVLTGADEYAVGVRGDALDRRDVALERPHDLGHGDVPGLPGEGIAAVRAAPRLDEPRLAEPLDEVLEICEWESLRVGDRAQRDRAVAARLGEVSQDAHAVLGLGREHHRTQILPGESEKSASLALEEREIVGE